MTVKLYILSNGFCINYPSVHVGAAIVIATPGRLIDLITTKGINMINVSYLVLDEMDRMMAQGFIEQITLISQQIRPDRQSLLFSATFPGKLRDVANVWVDDAVFIRCSTLEFESKQQSSDSQVKMGNNLSSLAASAHFGASTIEPNSNADSHETKCNTDTLAKPTDADGSDMIGSGSSSFTISKDIEQQVHVCASHKKPRYGEQD